MTEATGTPEAKVGQTVVAPQVGLPARLDMKRAFDVYVAGRNRTLGPEEKGTLVGGPVETPLPGPSAETPRPEVPAAQGIPVPDELRFDRNAGTWRRGLLG
jgi:hypothetical protein